MNALSTSRRAAAHRKSAIAMLMVAGGLAAAMPVRAAPEAENTPIETANKAVVPCAKTETVATAP
jgi:hypothetical protein